MKNFLLTFAVMLAVLAGASYTVVLKEVGPHKVKVIKVLRTQLGVELKEAFDMLEEMPAVIKENATEEEMESLKSELEALGAVVEITKVEEPSQE
ncbi:MAG: ribosomal protein L7/L12 [Bacteroidales bacterium]|nr:ribosomal protein L7/L12 [Bacteroidales bacterium]